MDSRIDDETTRARDSNSAARLRPAAPAGDELTFTAEVVAAGSPSDAAHAFDEPLAAVARTGTPSNVVSAEALPREERMALARQHTRSAVAAVVHDRLIPRALRGLAVPFEQKAAALANRVRSSADTLAGTGLPELERLARHVRKCQLYGTKLATAGTASPHPCGNRLCPNCYARSLDERYRALRTVDPAVLTVVQAKGHLGSNGPEDGEVPVAPARRCSSAHTRPRWRHAVPRHPGGPGARQIRRRPRLRRLARGDLRHEPADRRRQPRRAHSGGGGALLHGAAEQYLADAVGFATVLAKHLSFDWRLMILAQIEDLPRLLILTSRMAELSEVAPYKPPPGYPYRG